MAKGSQAAETKDKQKAAVQLPAGAGGNWWSAVQKEIRQSEYKIIRQEETSLPDVKVAYQAPNRAQNLRTYFTPTGIRIVRRTESAPGWQWSMHLTGYGYAGEVKSVDEARLAVSENRIEYRRGGVVEWYVNDEKGLEQGFTLAGPPESNGGKTKSEIVLEMAVAGELEGRMSKDGNIVTFVTGEGGEVLNYGGLVAKDAVGRELESRISLSEGRITLKIDASGAQYPVIIDPVITGLPTTADWMAEGDSLGAVFGVSVSTAGDVNGDGYDDVIVGAYVYDSGQEYEGKAFVYHGSATGLSFEANWTAEGDSLYAIFGYSVATAGDVNGDGFDDVIVGAYAYDNGQIDEGAAFLYHGSAAGLSTSPAWTAEGNQTGAFFGVSVATAGDVNGDGFDDVIIGAPFYDNDHYDEGAAFLYRSSALGLSVEPVWSAEGGQADSGFGWRVATAGDVNGDGMSDVIVGAPYYDNGETYEGMVFVYYGRCWLKADLTGDCDVDFFDFSMLVNYWRAPSSVVDLTGDGFIDRFDLRVLTRQWLAENTPPPAQASNPNPSDGSGISNLETDLSWTACPYAESHDLYFGTSSPPPFKRNQTDTTFDPGTLTSGTQYYWRIDEVGIYETTMGSLWSFTVMAGP